MGMLSLNRLMLKQERRRRRRIRAHNGSILVPQKINSLCQEGGYSQGGERPTFSGSDLPEDIWCHIHSLMSLCDSACSACVSRTFLCSWKCHPKLTFTDETLGLKQNADGKSSRTEGFTWRVNNILKTHSGVGVRSLKIVIGYNEVDPCDVNRWLQKAITPGIEEVTLLLPIGWRAEYNFPCSLLFDGRGNSIRYLCLIDCAIRPPVGFDCLRSLTELYLDGVHITGDELEHLIFKSFCLEKLELRSCIELICLKIPLWLDRLSWLIVSSCHNLQVIENTAPNLTTFELSGDQVQHLLGESSPVKNFNLAFSSELNSVSCAITKLPSVMPHLETLTIYSGSERVNTPMVTNEFLHLKYLNIELAAADDENVFGTYDYLSLVSFLDASPVLETFILSVDQHDMHHESVFGVASLHRRRIHEHKHDRLKKAQINGFCSAKSMAELTCYIVENATALESLTLDSIFNHRNDANDFVRCSGWKNGKCIPKSKQMIEEAHKALKAIELYILERIPSTVKLYVRRPCVRCHVVG